MHLQALRLERWLADEKCIQNAANRPDIHFVRVTSLGQHLGCNVVRRAAECPAGEIRRFSDERNSLFAFSIIVQFRCQSKIADFHFHLLVQEQIAQFQVAVNDLASVQVLCPEAHLHRSFNNKEILQRRSCT